MIDVEPMMMLVRPSAMRSAHLRSVQVADCRLIAGLLPDGLQGTPRTWARGWRASTSARGG